MNRFLLFVIVFFSSLASNAQVATFNWNGTVVNVATYPDYYKGTVQQWQVPQCVTSITVSATGGAGGAANYSSLHNGGLGAKLTGTLTVTPLHFLYIVVGGQGGFGDGIGFDNGGGGGGGTYIWDNTTSTLLVVAGGGSGAGIGEDGVNGQTINTSIASLEAARPSTNCGVGGTLGNGGAAGGTPGSAACGGAGWVQDGHNLIAGAHQFNGGGFYPKSAVTPGYGGPSWQPAAGPFTVSGFGGFGGGGGGGYNAGGGGGGYNGGGGGSGGSVTAAHSGGGGGSYFNGGNNVLTTTGALGSNGSVTIQWVTGATITATMTGHTGVSCNGSNDGTATVVASTGTPPFAYSWSPSGGSNSVGTGLSAGTYTVTVSENGCGTGTASVTITQPTAVTITPAIVTPSNCGAGTGTAAITAGGGAGGYVYLWTPSNQTNATATALGSGNYVVTVTDSHGCNTTQAVSIGSTGTLNVTMGPSTDVLCFGSNTGSATVIASSGVTPYTYLWSDPNAQTTVTATGLSAGVYNVTATDANGCSGNASVTITQPALSLTATTNFQHATCGNPNGSAHVIAQGGVSPYTYLWSDANSQTTATASALSVGCYTVKVTDNNNCDVLAPVCITQSAPITVSLVSQSNVSCNGLANGSITIAGGGGSPPYAYSWAPAGGNTATASNLSAGVYTATITDNSSCSNSLIISITQSLPLTATMAPPINIDCFGNNNGSATVIGGGGTPPYTYLWSDANTQITATAIGLAAGTYTATITTGNSSCSATAIVTIAEPPLLTATIGGIIYPACNGNSNGSATATAAGGTAPYTYSWTPAGGNNPTASNLSINTYTITVTDNNHCTATASVDISQPGVLTTTLTATNITCFGNTNGVITPTTTGGTQAYNYSWSNGQITTNATGLTAGTYSVTVTDAHGCSTSANTNITSPTLLTASASGPSATCAGIPVTFSSTASGGSIPYTYSWAPTGGNAASATITPNVTATYSITVSDNNGCTATATLPITVSPPLVVNLGGTNSVCPGGTANMIANATGGDGVYQYVWTPGNQNGRTASYTLNNNAEITVQVTDGCGSPTATANAAVVVNPLPAIAISADIMTGCAPLCVQFHDLSTIASGNITTQAWTFGTLDSAYTTAPIYCYKNSGLFTVKLTATSDSGCSSTKVISNMINVYPSPVASFSYSPGSVNILDPEVQFTDQSTGQSPINQWYWRFGQGDSTSSLRNPTHYYPDTGTYCPTLIVVDAHGCIDSITNCFVVNPQFSFYIPDAFSPNADNINDVFMPKGTYAKSYEMYIFDRWGTQLFHTTDINTGWNGNINNGTQACIQDTYIYLINVTDSQNNPHSYTGKVTLIR